MKQCLYEVLGVERDASAAELKAAFHRQSRLWHPDKAAQNGVSYEEATARSQAINGAWEVLGNPDERKLYDSHRSEILSSPDELSSEFELNLWPYFSPSAFSGYGGDANGFYAVYASAFGRIAAQEEVFHRRYGSGGSIKPPPSFGGPSSSYGEVAAFYSYWSGFKTVKDYSWCEEYDVAEAPNRKVRRLMEDENRKARKKEQRDFNDSVRQLAAFVKKRDKRVLEHQVELQRVAKEKEKEMKARREMAAAERMREVEGYEEQEWAKVAEVEDDEVWAEKGRRKKAAEAAAAAEEEAEEERREFYCVLCQKSFRSEKQWHNHEKSKKHSERAAALKETLLEEDERVRAKVEAAAAAEEAAEERRRDRSKPATKKKKAKPPPLSSESEGDGDEEDLLEAMMDSHRKRWNVDRDEDSEEAESIEVDDPVEKEDPAASAGKEPEIAAARSEEDQDEDEDEEEIEDKDEEQVVNLMKELKTEDPEKRAEKKPIRKKNRRKDKGKKPAPEPKASKKPGKNKASAAAAAAIASSTCEVCGKDFDSRNLLFKHVESTNHFALKHK